MRGSCGRSPRISSGVLILDFCADRFEPPINRPFDRNLLVKLSLLLLVKFPHLLFQGVPDVADLLSFRLSLLRRSDLGRNGFAGAVLEEVEVLGAFAAAPLWLACRGAAGRMTGVDIDGLGLRTKPPKIEIGHWEL